MNRNAFEALCFLASRENWCWNLFCTTCGHMYFRYAFIELLQGHHPDDGNWATRKGNHRNLERRVGSMHSMRDWDLMDMVALQKVCEGADIRKISEQCRFPDWLGYLGLVLGHACGAEAINGKLTKAWAGQLADLVVPGSEAEASLREKAGRGKGLDLDDLELVEHDISYENKSWRGLREQSNLGGRY